MIESPTARDRELYHQQVRRAQFPKLEYTIQRLVYERAKEEALIIEGACAEALVRRVGVLVTRYKSGAIDAIATDVVPFGTIEVRGQYV